MNDVSQPSDIQPKGVVSGDVKHVAGVRHGFAKHIIIPVSIGIGIILMLFMLSASIIAVTHLNAYTQERLTTLAKSVDQLVQHETDKLGAVAESIAIHGRLADALIQKDRATLLRISAPLFAALTENYSITHFYYHNVDGTNFLRVHHPQRFGDIIDRYTLSLARHSGTVAAGIEIGVLGTYTLRLVKPWHYQDQLIGYVEIGLEIDHMFEELRRITGAALAVVIDKQYLTQAQWQQGNVIFGRDSDWDRLTDSVVLAVFGDFAEHALLNVNVQKSTSQWLTGGGIVYRTLPINDIQQRTIGRLHIALDESVSREGTIEIVSYLTLVVGLSLLALIVILRAVTNRVEGRLNTAIAEKSDFERRTKYDQMTSVYNQQEFYRLLDLELERAVRQQAPLSVILLDIDFFKSVNDKHGHQIGDCVLRGLALELLAYARDIDHLARYGGEEFTVILPNTALLDAREIAERWRTVIERRVFQCDGQSLNITISLGVANYPLHADTSKALLQYADMAMYKAKRRGRNRVEVYTAR
jgi:diguanylate cyclase (GGDEF)-like protein